MSATQYSFFDTQEQDKSLSDPLYFDSSYSYETTVFMFLVLKNNQLSA